MTTEQQLGFDGLLQSAETENRARHFERRTAHLPGTMDEALPLFRDLLARHHDAMLTADVDETMRLRGKAHDLAKKLNGGEPGIIAHEDAPGCMLERETAAAPGSVPLWGQKGEFVINVDGMRVRVEVNGVFGIGSRFGYWPGFSAHAVEPDKPFLSQTGYRSFLGVYAEAQPGITPDMFAADMMASYIVQELQGRLLTIKPEYRKHREDRS